MISEGEKFRENTGRNFINIIAFYRFTIEYEFSERFVNIRKSMGPW